jgi:hypothetical protein
VQAITQSTRRIPYGMRYFARETLASLQVRNTFQIYLARNTDLTSLHSRKRHPKHTRPVLADWSIIDTSIRPYCEQLTLFRLSLNPHMPQDSGNIRHCPEDDRRPKPQESGADIKDPDADHEWSGVWRGQSCIPPDQPLRAQGYHTGDIVALGRYDCLVSFLRLNHLRVYKWPTSPMPKPISMPMSFSTRQCSQNQYTSPPMRCTRCMHSYLSIRTNW